MIDFEGLNCLIHVWISVGVLFLIISSCLGLVIACYFLMKISKMDNDNFKRRVREALKDGSTNSKK